MSTIGTFTLIKNEARWIRAHLFSWLPHVDEMVFFDGNSTDGTLEIIKDIRANHPFGHRITLIEDKDPKDLQDDYVRLFNECLHTLKTDYAAFIHPDMILDDPGNIGYLGDSIAYFTHMRSFAGEPGGQLYEILDGRSDKWFNIYRLRNPDLGLHYFGHYGAAREGCYFSEITGDRHDFFANRFDLFPHPIADSGIKISHFSDVRTPERRRDRMYKCLINQGHDKANALLISAKHPRVTFEDGQGFRFVKCEYPPCFREGANV